MKFPIQVMSRQCSRIIIILLLAIICRPLLSVCVVKLSRHGLLLRTFAITGIIAHLCGRDWLDFFALAVLEGQSFFNLSENIFHFHWSLHGRYNLSVPYLCQRRFRDPYLGTHDVEGQRIPQTSRYGCFSLIAANSSYIRNWTWLSYFRYVWGISGVPWCRGSLNHPSNFLVPYLYLGRFRGPLFMNPWGQWGTSASFKSPGTVMSDVSGDPYSGTHDVEGCYRLWKTWSLDKF